MAVNTLGATDLLSYDKNNNGAFMRGAGTWNLNLDGGQYLVSSVVMIFSDTQVIISFYL